MKKRNLLSFTLLTYSILWHSCWPHENHYGETDLTRQEQLLGGKIAAPGSGELSAFAGFFQQAMDRQ